MFLHFFLLTRGDLLLSAVVRRALSIVFALNDIFSETTAPRALKFDMKHCLVDLFQVCSVAGPGVQNYPAAGGLVFKYEICLKIFSRNARLRCLKFDM